MSLRETLADYDEAVETYQEASDDDGGSVKDYENYEDSVLDFAADVEPTVRALVGMRDEIVEVLNEIEASTEADSMDPVFDARDRAGDLLAAILTMIEGREDGQPVT